MLLFKPRKRLLNDMLLKKSLEFILKEQRSNHSKKLHISNCFRFKGTFFTNTCYFKDLKYAQSGPLRPLNRVPVVSSQVKSVASLPKIVKAVPDKRFLPKIPKKSKDMLNQGP